MNISQMAACELFLQWNVQGMSTSREDLINMIDNYKPIAIAVQETFQGGDFVVRIVGYNGICKQGHFNQRVHGGVAMYIHNSMPYREIHIKTNLKIIAAQVNVSQYKTITCVSAYIPGCANFNDEELGRIIHELPQKI